MTPKKVYITTSIPYVNAPPHIGHALELVQADALARSYRQLGHSVILQTGTDENAGKNVLAAREQGISTQVLVDRKSALFNELVIALKISEHSFIRTTDPGHAAGVAELFSRFNPDDLYWDEYKGLYCVGCEDFITPSQLVEGNCPDHNTPPEITRERNLFFKLSRYQEKLERLIEEDAIRILPASRKEEIVAFIRGGLRDISVSRPAGRVGGWGIPLPGADGHVVYVWIDALINYLSGLGFGTGEAWADVWNPETLKIHVIGKNVWKFHAVYWPAMLLSAGLEAPDWICVHGFLTADGRKIGKSLGNAVDPVAAINDYGADAVRLQLLSYPTHSDGDYSDARLAETYTSVLAHGIGNLASRVVALAVQVGVESAGVPPSTHTDRAKNIRDLFCAFRLSDAVSKIVECVDLLNGRIASDSVWELRKQNPDRARKIVLEYLASLREIVDVLPILIPDGAARIADHLDLDMLLRLPPLYPPLGR